MGDDYLWRQRVRGLMVGLALGDAVGGARQVPADGQLRMGVATQMAAFTAEGLIRAMVRGHHKGIVDPVGVVWHAYGRWAAVQGLATHDLERPWGQFGVGPWPDGWLATVPSMAKRRGSAPTTVKAVTGGAPGTIEEPVSNSTGAHALTRTLPAAALSRIWPREESIRHTERMAALSHGHVEAQWATSTGVLWTSACLTGSAVVEALLATDRMDMGTVIGHGRDRARSDPGSARHLAAVAPDASARSALAGAVYATHSFPAAADAIRAVELAATAPGGRSAAAVTGAVLGATHGVDVWPADLVSRLEAIWVIDTLGRDLAMQLTENPGGDEHTPPADPHWWDRYPGW